MAVPWFCNDLQYHSFCGLLWFTVGLLGFTIVKLYLQWFYCFCLHPLVGFAIVLL